MKNTGISWETEEMEARKNEVEVFRNGKVIKASLDSTDYTTNGEREPEADFAKVVEGVLGLMNKVKRLQEENMVLREENALLQQKVYKLENDELCKVVNLETIAKYGLRQTHPKTVQIIVNMLNRLCVGKGCVPDRLRSRIEDLEDHIMELESPQPMAQHNHGCQNFYGTIKDSDFHS